MKLNQLKLEKLEIPFHTSFKHAQGERKATEAVLASAYDVQGIIGYGEGCPRSYVTLETIESCFAFFDAHREAILQVDSLDSLRAFKSAHHAGISQNPAAWCAIETAILDLLAKVENKTLEALLGLSEIDGRFQYTAVLGASSHESFKAKMQLYVEAGFTDFKVKIVGDDPLDSQNLGALRAALPNAKIRIDANNLFKNADEAIADLSRFAKDTWAIEEPIGPRDYEGLKKISEHLGCKIILDESFLSIEDLSHIDSSIWIPNLRISKLGGLLNSLEIARKCEERGIQFVIGAQVGETSILTRLALSVANSYRHCVIAQEGAFGTYLLEHDICAEPIMFKVQGLLELDTKGTVGLGLTFVTVRP